MLDIRLQVDWVLQWDPPSNASAFVHRVGRTARQGHAGSALILLLENEEAYVPFIETNQRVKLIKLEDTVTHEMVNNLAHFHLQLFYFHFYLENRFKGTNKKYSEERSGCNGERHKSICFSHKSLL